MIFTPRLSVLYDMTLIFPEWILCDSKDYRIELPFFVDVVRPYGFQMADIIDDITQDVWGFYKEVERFI
jgi:hypothetical protein